MASSAFAQKCNLQQFVLQHYEGKVGSAPLHKPRTQGRTSAAPSAQRQSVAARASSRDEIVPRAVAEKLAGSSEEAVGFNVEIDNDCDEDATVIRVTGLNRPGLLAALTTTFQNLDLEVIKVAVKLFGVI